MRFVTVRDFRGNSRRVWKELKQRKELVITSNGKPIAILHQTSEDTLEESLAAIRSARAIAAVEEIRRDAARRGLDKMSLKEINREIAAVRRANKR